MSYFRADPGVVRDCELRKKSSSGGLFSEIASVILHAEGGVYGAAFDREFRLKHVGVFSEKELDRLRGSKYLQSDTGTTFSQVRDLLRQGKSVYYTGTPCQIAGLKKFLRREYENLFTSDLACHGVPSQKIFLRIRIIWNIRMWGVFQVLISGIWMAGGLL